MTQEAAPYQVDPEIMAEFIAGSEEHIAEAENDLIELEKNPASETLINDIFRHFHTIKGDAGSVGVDAVREVAHELETLLDKLREKTLVVEPRLLDLLLEGLSNLAVSVKSVARGINTTADASLLEKLKAYTPEADRRSVVEDADAPIAYAAEHTEMALQATQLMKTPASEHESDEADELENTFIAFRTGSIQCAISVNESNEIIGQPYITPVMNVEKFIEGVINLRGSIVPVVHLARRLGLEAKPSQQPQILVLLLDGARLGLLVDEVLGVRSWAATRLMRPESVAFDLKRTFVTDVVVENSQIILLLNTQEILKRKEV